MPLREGRLLPEGSDDRHHELSGSTLTEQELAWRTALALGYVIISMLGVAAVRVLLNPDKILDRCSARNDRPPHRLDRCYCCRQTQPMRYPFLPTRHWLAFVDLFRDPILWRDVVRGLVVQFRLPDRLHSGGLGQQYQGRRRLKTSAGDVAGYLLSFSAQHRVARGQHDRMTQQVAVSDQRALDTS